MSVQQIETVTGQADLTGVPLGNPHDALLAQQPADVGTGSRNRVEVHHVSLVNPPNRVVEAEPLAYGTAGNPERTTLDRGHDGRDTVRLAERRAFAGTSGRTGIAQPR
jgi:hypothetical protein